MSELTNPNPITLTLMSFENLFFEQKTFAALFHKFKKVCRRYYYENHESALLSCESRGYPIIRQLFDELKVEVRG